MITFTLYDDMNVFQIFKDLQKISEFKVSIFLYYLHCAMKGLF